MSSVYDHPEWRAFVDRIRESPDDDLLRLVAADWLDERGEADRAELIRVQCWIAAHERATGDKLIAGPERRRERELLGIRLTSTDRWVKIANVEACMVRGFAEQVRCTAFDWVDWCDRLIAREPVREVKLTTMPGAELIYKASRQWKKPLDNSHSHVMPIFEAEWPGIKFGLPPIIDASWYVRPDASPIEDLRSFRDQLLNFPGGSTEDAVDARR